MKQSPALAVVLFVAASRVGSAAGYPTDEKAGEVHLKWMGPDGVALPFSEEEELLEFLRTAEITKTKVLTSGKNRPLKVRLEKDGVQANAIFRNVDEKRDWTTIYGKSYRDFHDSCFYECAAYELSRLLGLDTVPPCVVRNAEGREGTMQLWVENAETMSDRVEKGSGIVSNRHWGRQRQMMHVFDALIHNFDRNQGNILFGADDKLWFIDHTRSFSLSSELDAPEQIVWCERGMFEKMKSLNKDLLTERLGPKVEYGRIIALLKRRDKLVAHIQSLIDTRGEDAVLFDVFAAGNGKIER